jgi:hypothetical protein
VRTILSGETGIQWGHETEKSLGKIAVEVTLQGARLGCFPVSSNKMNEASRKELGGFNRQGLTNERSTSHGRTPEEPPGR